MFSRRWHLFEFHDLSFTPKFFRALITDFLLHLWILDPLPFLPKKLHIPFLPETLGIPFFSVCADRLGSALQRSGDNHIVDLCSGSGGPLPSIQKELAKKGINVSIVLTDLVPHVDRYERLEREATCARGQFAYSKESVDATQCKLKGFRTLFASYHHFEPEMAKKIVQDAIDTRSGIAIFEATERSFYNVFFYFPIFVPLISFIFGCFTKPRSLLRVLFTLFVPLIPFVAGFDGAISSLRTYSPDEMREMISTLRNAEDYEWDIGVDKYLIAPNCVYYIGVPKSKAK